KFLEPFSEQRVEPSASPAIAGALAHLDCELSSAVQAADHTVFFGRVRAARASGAGAPLVYHRRAYATAVGPASTRSTSAAAWPLPIPFAESGSSSVDELAGGQEARPRFCWWP